MRLLNSLWTGTSRFRLKRDHLLVQTLALNLASKYHGAPIFSTDKAGASLAKELAWPVQIERWLDDIPAAGLRHVWALGKLHSLAKAPFPVLQFDGDVLILDMLPGWFITAGIVAQSIDYLGGYQHANMIEFRERCGYDPTWKPYNCGLVGGNDHDAVRRYAVEAIEKAKLFKPDTFGTGISMIVEQWSLGKYSPTVLDSGHPYHSDFLGRQYAHLAGERKQNPSVISDVIITLESEFPQALNDLETGIERIKQTPNHALHRFLKGGQL